MNKAQKLTEKKIDPNTLSGQTLAYLGDGIYEAAIRRHLIKGGMLKPQNLQRTATHYVSAKAQAGLIAKMLDTGFLTEEEETAYRRGRNAKTHTKAKNTSLATYEMSTGFEAVFGYLDLAGEEGRVKELIAWCIDEVESEGTREYVFN